jgi:uncharacterized protein YbjT (DUF2867 family)
VARVLVTGGSGTLGSYLVPRLIVRGHGVRVVSRHQPSKLNPSSVEAVRGDVASGDGLASAFVDIDVVVHAASLGLRRGAHRVEVRGTQNVLTASRAAGAHFVYVSIVGVDHHRLPYYRAKWEAEQLIAASSSSWAIQRATQFHDLLAEALRSRVMPTTKNLSYQLVDAGEVSDRLVDLVESQQPGRAPDFGGPEILPMREIVRTWREETGRRVVTVPVPRVHFLNDLDRGRHLCPAQASGRITWREWLRRQTPGSADG